MAFENELERLTTIIDEQTVLLKKVFSMMHSYNNSLNIFWAV